MSYKMSYKWLAGMLALSLMVGMTGTALADDAANAQSEQLFKQLDKNNDGKLVASEIEEQQAKFFERLVRVGDKDKDEALSQEEFTTALNAKEETVPATGLNGGGNKRGNKKFDLATFFKRMDKNSDGKLTKDELPEQVQKRLAPLFRKLGKEEVSLAEFQANVRPDPNKTGRKKSQPGKKQIAKFFERFDKNSDGKLEKSELPEKLQERLQPLFDKLGKDSLTVDDIPQAGQRKNKKGNKKTAKAEEKVATAETVAEEEKPQRPEGKRPPRGKRPEGPEGRRPPGALFFTKLDTNDDGKLSKGELSKAGELFAELDKNEDGSLDPRELFGAPPMRGKGPGDRPKRPEAGKRGPRPNFAAKFIERLDKNDDGKVSREEAGEKFGKRFDRLDTNKDDSIDEEELKQGFANRRNRPEGKGKGKRPEKPKAAPEKE